MPRSGVTGGRVTVGSVVVMGLLLLGLVVAAALTVSTATYDQSDRSYDVATVVAIGAGMMFVQCAAVFTWVRWIAGRETPRPLIMLRKDLAVLALLALPVGVIAIGAVTAN